MRFPFSKIVSIVCPLLFLLFACSSGDEPQKSNPGIAVHQEGTPLPNGSGSFSFGRFAVGTTSYALPFTIKNTGPGLLTVSTLSLGGGDAAEFHSTFAPIVVPPGGDTTFTLSFTPTSAGTKSASVSIFSNDLDDNPTTFDVQGTADAAKVKMAYLQAVTASSVCVLAETPDPSPLVAVLGTSEKYGRLASTASTLPTNGGTFVHRIFLTGLAPGTVYHYRLESFHSSFQTAAGPGTHFRFAWLADCRTNTAVHDAIASRILAAAPHFSLYGGDLCVNGSSYESYKSEFFRPNQLALAAGIPFFNATGNHEKWEANTKAFTQGPDSVSGNQGYYSFDYGDLHVVVMNYQDPGGYGPGSPQWNFVAADLAATRKPWKIVTCHAPAYASGGHGENSTMIALTRQVFEPNQVDLVVCGHDHFYQRNLVNAITHLIIGAAGAELYAPGPVGGYVQVSLKTNCYAIFDVGPATLRVHAYDEKGAEIDRLVLNR